MKQKIIAIGGPHGSGKSSVAKRLAETFEMNYDSAGVVFRDLAHERNVTLEELSKIAMEESSIDREIDDRTKKLGVVPNTIVDAQLAAYFTPKDAAIRISITAAPDIRWQRIARRDSSSIDQAKAETETREEAEKKRFLNLYSINIDDLSLYDVIINNDRMSENDTYLLCEAIVRHVLQHLS